MADDRRSTSSRAIRWVGVGATTGLVTLGAIAVWTDDGERTPAPRPIEAPSATLPPIDRAIPSEPAPPRRSDDGTVEFDIDRLRVDLDETSDIVVEDLGDLSTVLALQTGAMLPHDECRAASAAITGDAGSTGFPFYFC